MRKDVRIVTKSPKMGPLLIFSISVAALVGPVQTIFILIIYYINFFVPIAQLAGQAVVLGCLSLSMCLCLHLISKVYPQRRDRIQKRSVTGLLPMEAIRRSWILPYMYRLQYQKLRCCAAQL
jgi:hypothetical protein